MWFHFASKVRAQNSIRQNLLSETRRHFVNVKVLSGFSKRFSVGGWTMKRVKKLAKFIENLIFSSEAAMAFRRQE
jgi:hypothetical protein